MILPFEPFVIEGGMSGHEHDTRPDIAPLIMFPYQFAPTFCPTKV